MVKEATDEIGDMAGRAWGQYKRHKFRKKVQDSPLEAVDDPVGTAVVMMLAVAKEAGPITPEMEAAAHREITRSLKIAEPNELLVFSKWVTSHVQDANNVSPPYAKALGRRLKYGRTPEIRGHGRTGRPGLRRCDRGPECQNPQIPRAVGPDRLTLFPGLYVATPETKVNALSQGGTQWSGLP